MYILTFFLHACFHYNKVMGKNMSSSQPCTYQWFHAHKLMQGQRNVHLWVCRFITYVHIKFHLPSYNGSSVTTIMAKPKGNIYSPAMLFQSLQEYYLIKHQYFPKTYHHI